jgi:hypothetical protein
MEKQLQYVKLKFTDWSNHTYLTNEQRKQLIQEKIERAKIHYLAMQRSPYKVVQ